MTNRETLRSLAEQLCPLEICAAPGCLNMTSQGICDDCDDWVSAEVAMLGRSDDDLATPPSPSPDMDKDMKSHG